VTSKDPSSLEIDFLCTKKDLGVIIDKCYKVHSNTDTVLMMDAIKDMGYHYSTKSAITISIADMEIPEEKHQIIQDAEAVVDQCEDFYNRGLYTEKERYDKVCSIWSETTDKVADVAMDSLDGLNNLKIMANSGARGSKKQISQIGGMRGLMANATGKTVEIPIKANFREGLSVLDYFVSTNGARKGLADTALRTADSGYLTRRLVDVSHNVIVRELDCWTDEGIEVNAFAGDSETGKDVIEPLHERIAGRISLTDICHPETGEVLVPAGEEITDNMALEIENLGIKKVAIRSIMTCHCRNGVCAKCYGRNLATGELVNIGESVGITAAQSIGEPGTQLTMRTFHTGGVAGGDITQGLPRVEELFEARKPKGLAEICEEDGVVESITTTGKTTKVVIRGEDGARTYDVPYGARLSVQEGKEVEAGDNLTRGPLDPHDIMRINGVVGVYNYLLKEVQKVYRLQGVDINDKHIEVIVSQMLSKYRIEDAGETDLLPGSMYSRFEIEEANAKAEEEGRQPAEYQRQLLGITKASLATSSFLSAASFQETTRVLTDAAIKGKNDTLQGLKENVIIGKLIPAGTGMKRYRDIEVDYGPNTEYVESYSTREEEEDENIYMAESEFIPSTDTMLSDMTAAGEAAGGADTAGSAIDDAAAADPDGGAEITAAPIDDAAAADPDGGAEITAASIDDAAAADPDGGAEITAAPIDDTAAADPGDGAGGAADSRDSDLD
jgi:DNA-directed RNA polymerase subunit beta'